MSSSTSVSSGCFNPSCKEAKTERFRKGWRLRNGELAELCDRCASAYEEGRYCETFHSDADGWRNCESCGKPVHCGCIVSFHAFVLLDDGGVECMACANKNFVVAPNPVWPSPLFLHLPLPERLKDLSTKNWNPFAGPSAASTQWRQAPNLWNAATAQTELHLRMPYEIDRSNGIDKLISGERLPAPGMEKVKSADQAERLTSNNQKTSHSEKIANGDAGINTGPASNAFHKEEVVVDGLQHSRHFAGDKEPVEARRVIAEPGRNSPAAVINYDTLQNVNMSVQSVPKDDTSSSQVGFGLPYALPNETNGPTKVFGSQSQRQMHPSTITKPLLAGPHNGVESTSETLGRNGRPRGDARGRHHLLPRYWPRITDQELQQISGDSNSVITPLFEKMLSASDAGRIGRLVLPKKCAEAYFPSISQPEGLPLRVQDARGREWVFQFRFWPNNNSRMYVLEGVTPCIQSMQLQAGDTVTFSRIDPEGKLVMGFRKASNVPPSDQDMQTPKSGNGILKNGEVNSADPSFWSKVDKSGYIAKEVPGVKASLPTKRKNSTLGSKSKRLRIENEDSIELKITWEEAQGLLRPPPNHSPNTVTIEGHEFEEYGEAPILGKPTFCPINQVGEKFKWVQCEDCSKWRKLPFDELLPSQWTCSKNSWDPKRSSCSSAQELTIEQLEDLLSSKNNVPKKTKTAKQVTEIVEASEGLDTLANLAILGEGEVLPSSSQATTKHPRHRPGCSCIVCIQPPSGKGPKHKQTCTCNVCLTVKRRFRTLMMRREKRQSEKEAETVRKKQQQLQQPLEPEQEDDPPLSSNTSNSSSNPKHPLVTETVDEETDRKRPFSSPLKGQIDLNIQPEREDETSPASDSCSIMRLFHDATEQCIREQTLSSSANDRDPIVDQIEPSRGGGDVDEGPDGVPCGSGHLDGDLDHPVTLSISVSASTSATV